MRGGLIGFAVGIGLLLFAFFTGLLIYFLMGLHPAVALVVISLLILGGCTWVFWGSGK